MLDWDKQIADIIAWMDKRSKAKYPNGEYRLTLVIPLTGPVRFEWRHGPVK